MVQQVQPENYFHVPKSVRPYDEFEPCYNSSINYYPCPYKLPCGYCKQLNRMCIQESATITWTCKTTAQGTNSTGVEYVNNATSQ